MGKQLVKQCWTVKFPYFGKGKAHANQILGQLTARAGGAVSRSPTFQHFGKTGLTKSFCSL